MKKVMTIAGTRPELIRLSEIIRKLDRYYQHVFVHTGQNFDEKLHGQFFEDLDLRRPDYQFNLQEKAVGVPFIGAMLQNIAGVLDEETPAAALILGDTNSCLAAYVCKQRHIPVFHMEAGNRCYSDEVPEEVNRRIVDSCSDYLLPYTQRSREQLLREGFAPSRIIVTGNPITEVLFKRLEKAKGRESAILEKFGVQAKSFCLATLHRTENVTHPGRLKAILEALNATAERGLPVLLSVHPKLSSMLAEHQVKLGAGVRPSSPLSFTEFSVMMRGAKIVISDSGTVPEEACALGVPCVLIRNSTERPELLETNAMVVSGTETDAILSSVAIALGTSVGPLPLDYRDLEVSDKIVKLLARTEPASERR